MARDILSEYGRDSHQPQAPRARHGGEMDRRDVMNYKPPQGPSNLHHVGPGLGGKNLGHGQKFTDHHESGHPGISHENHGNKGTQR